MRRIGLLTAFALALVLAACASQGSAPQRDPQLVTTQLTELSQLPCPANLDTATWDQLKSALRAVILAPPRRAAVNPQSAAWRAIMVPGASGGVNGWWYNTQGDYDQNGEVNISDLTPLGVHFHEAGPFDFTSAESVIDGDSNGEINIADITPIGVNLGISVFSYNVYGSDAASDIPGDGADSTVTPLGSAQFSAATGNRVVDRLFFPYPAGLDQDLAYHWVRPSDGTANAEGIRSTVLGQGFTIDLASPPAQGDGSFADPYLLGNDADFELLATLEFGGDVTVSPGTTFTPFPLDAATISGLTLHVGSGNQTFTLSATYADYPGDPDTETSNIIYLRKGLPDQPPAADLSIGPDSGPRPLAATLDASGSTDDGAIVKYEWDLDGDGTFERDGGLTPTLDFTFTAAGPQNPAVRVTDDGGHTATASAPVNVEGSWHIVTVDSTENFNSPSLAIVNGLPAIAYTDDAVDKLVFVRALDADGTTWGAPIIPLPFTPGGFLPSLVIANGHPMVIYQGQPPTNICGFTRAEDTDGTLWITSGIFPFASNGICATIVNGNPALAYHDVADNKLYYLRANNTVGNDWPATSTLVDSNAIVDGPPSLAVIGGEPAITYKDSDVGFFMYCVASDADGTAWETPIAADVNAGNATFTSLLEIGGVPAFASNTGFSAHFTQAADPNGINWSLPVGVGPGFCPLPMSMGLASGLPIIAFDTPNSDEVRFAMAADTAGSAWGGEVVDSSSDTGADCLEVNGHPAIAYIGATSGELKYAVFF